VTDLDLDAIRARYDTWGGDAGDIPALLAEVERLRAQHAAALALHQPDDPTAFGVCCTTCVTELWPCPTVRALGVPDPTPATGGE